MLYFEKKHSPQRNKPHKEIPPHKQSLSTKKNRLVEKTYEIENVRFTPEGGTSGL